MVLGSPLTSSKGAYPTYQILKICKDKLDSREPEASKANKEDKEAIER